MVKRYLKTTEVSPEADLGYVLDIFIKELGLPRCLRDVGVVDFSLDQLAKSCLQDKWCKSNPKPLIEARQVAEILEKVR
jgi:alcohol dehydrogenase class IV